VPPRTYLTAPPGTEPSEATGRAAAEPRERYVPGLAAASEPTVPSRWRAPLAVVVVVALVVATIVLALRLSADAQAQDPSLGVPGTPEAPSDAEARPAPAAEVELDGETG
jgi:hypothetical protein